MRRQAIECKNLSEFCPNSLLDSPIDVFIERRFSDDVVCMVVIWLFGGFFGKMFDSDDTGREIVNVGRQKGHLNLNRESTLVYTCWQPKQISINVQLIIRARFFLSALNSNFVRCDIFHFQVLLCYLLRMRLYRSMFEMWLLCFASCIVDILSVHSTATGG